MHDDAAFKDDVNSRKLRDVTDDALQCASTSERAHRDIPLSTRVQKYSIYRRQGNAYGSKGRVTA